MNPHLIESKVMVNFKIACALVGYELANDLFDSFGLNIDETWEGKDDEAAAVVDALFYSEILSDQRR